MQRAVKFAGPDGLIEGHAIPFGGPFGGKDLDGEYFSPATDLCLDWFPAERPLLYQHGLDGGVGLSVVGRVKMDTFRTDDDGGWVQAQLDQQHAYFSRIKRLVEQGKLYFSSGAMARLIGVLCVR